MRLQHLGMVIAGPSESYPIAAVGRGPAIGNHHWRHGRLPWVKDLLPDHLAVDVGCFPEEAENAAPTPPQLPKRCSPKCPHCSGRLQLPFRESRGGLGRLRDTYALATAFKLPCLCLTGLQSLVWLAAAPCRRAPASDLPTASSC